MKLYKTVFFIILLLFQLTSCNIEGETSIHEKNVSSFFENDFSVTCHDGSFILSVSEDKCIFKHPEILKDAEIFLGGEERYVLTSGELEIMLPESFAISLSTLIQDIKGIKHKSQKLSSKGENIICGSTTFRADGDILFAVVKTNENEKIFKINKGL